MTRVLPGQAAGVTLGTVPYVALKISWLAGGDVGLRDPALMQTTTYVVANSITLVLDLILLDVLDDVHREWIAATTFEQTPGDQTDPTNQYDQPCPLLVR